jgi:hypothetical protein
VAFKKTVCFVEPAASAGRLPGLRNLAVCAAILGLAAACSSTQKTNLPCPGVSIVGELATLTKFREGPGRDLTDVSYQAGLRDLSGSCKYDDKGVGIEMRISVIADRGPANTDRTIDVPYFVAISNPEGAIVAKQIFSSRLDFPAGQNRIGSIEELTEQIPLAKGTSGGGYRVMVGFQLNADELTFNRRQRQGG